jgi:hypothetical protein
MHATGEGGMPQFAVLIDVNVALSTPPEIPIASHNLLATCFLRRYQISHLDIAARLIRPTARR